MSKHIKEEYYLTIIEGISPMTRVPATHYRVAGLGILKDMDCVPKVSTPNLPPIVKPSPGVIAPPCGFSVTPTTLAGGTGDEVQFNFTHKNTSGIDEVNAIYDPDKVEEVSEGRFRLLSEGSTQITFVAVYEDGQECTAKVSGTIEEGREDEYQDSGSVIVCPSETVEIGRVIIPSGHTQPLVIGMKFSTISGADFPDLNVKSPNGETFGYNDQYLSGGQSAVDTKNTSSSKATYTGYAPPGHDEEFVFEKPIAGEWIFYAQNSGGNQKSEVSFYVSEGVEFNLTYPGPKC